MTLSELTQRYVTFKQSLGLSFRSETGVLKAFCRVMGEMDIVDVPPSRVLAYLAGSGPLTSFWHTKFRVLQGFYRFAIGRGYVAVSPLPTILPTCPPHQPPYIYTTEEVRRLLTATEQFMTPLSPLQAMTFRTLLLVLYSTGVRISEALALTLADVQLADSLLLVRQSKFGKTRWVPTGGQLTAQLHDYAHQRSRLGTPLPSLRRGRGGRCAMAASTMCSVNSGRVPASSATTERAPNPVSMISGILPP